MANVRARSGGVNTIPSPLIGYSKPAHTKPDLPKRVVGPEPVC